MSTILSDGRPAAQNPGDNTSGPICDTKVSCAQCTNVMNNELATLKNEIKQLWKVTYCFLATLVAIVAVLMALMSFSRLPFTNTYVSPKDCFATGRGLEMAVVGKQANAVLHTVDTSGKGYALQMETVACEFVSEPSGIKFYCNVKKVMESQYEVSYQATSRGRHQLHIKVEGEHIKGSPFTVTVKLPVEKLGTPIKIINGSKNPWGVAVNKKGEILVAERNGHCISIFSPTGEKLGSFGSNGSRPGLFNAPSGVTVDDYGNILVADTDNHRIQKFTSDNKHITSVGSHGSNHLQFDGSLSVAISPITEKIATSDWDNHRVQIFNLNLTFHSSIGSKGRGNGEFNGPHDTAFDSTGNIYVTDTHNHRIQVFNPKGQFLRKFGNEGKGDGELDFPAGISIDSDNTVYVVEARNHRVSVFTCKGKFLTSFGNQGDGPGQFKYPHRITVDKNGIIYVADSDNNRIQIF
jgi:DNA-binding beta-propeller fold protein YncE